MTGLAREYGEGLYALAQEEHLEEALLAQLRELRGCFHDQPDFCRLLSNMSLSKQERTGILDKALRGQVHPYLLNFLKILCERGLLHEYDGCLQAYAALYNQAHGVLEAVVTTRAPLTPEQRDKLLAKLGQMTGKQIALQERVDASVLGGVMLEMDGKRYDNTLKHRLQAIHSAMTAQA